MVTALTSLGLSKKESGAYGAKSHLPSGKNLLNSRSPIDGKVIGSVVPAGIKEYESVVSDAVDGFKIWREVPAPKRGEIVREIGNALREHKKALGLLVTLETGKIVAEGEGEIQEAIDVADFAVGLSRQLCGNTMQSERARHQMLEQWFPLGPVGVITAFNFPAAVWAWNAMIAAVCGDTIIWKPSERTPLVAIALNRIAASIAERHGYKGVFTLLIGEGKELGERLCDDRRVPLISATGSCTMGRSVGERVAKRLGKTILELGGNNGVIVLKDADLNLVTRSTLFGSVGTAGQRCTTTRRLIVEKSILNELTKKLAKAYKQVVVGDPRLPKTLMGPLISKGAVDAFFAALTRAKSEGGKIIYGGKALSDMPSDLYVLPTIVKATAHMSIVREETFAPILYIIPANDLDDAIAIHNGVDQGLSSAIFTRDLQSAHRFISVTGSDCGIANINLGTSGAEIGGAFGGEKDTGGGRESGSDSWKQYMRRQTTTINIGDDLPLAQGITFG